MEGSILNRMVEAHTKKVNEIIEKKINVLSQQAFIRGEDILHDILKDIDVFNLGKTKNKLERFGYSLELEQTPPVYSLEDGNYKATFSEDNIKLKITKIIVEA
jgi:hypothetical protein